MSGADRVDPIPRVEAGTTQITGDSADKNPTHECAGSEGDAPPANFVPEPIPAVTSGLANRSDEASLGLRLLDAFEGAGDNVDTIEEALLEEGKRRWPRTIDRLTRRPSAVVPVTVRSEQPAPAKESPVTSPKPASFAPSKDDQSATAVVSAYEWCLKRPIGQPLGSQAKKEYIERKLGAGYWVKFCSRGDWVAIAREPDRAGHYVIPNPFTVSQLPVEKLKKFYPAMESSATRSQYTLLKPAWVGAPILENANFDIDEVEQTWQANGAAGEVRKND